MLGSLACLKKNAMDNRIPRTSPTSIPIDKTKIKVASPEILSSLCVFQFSNITEKSNRPIAETMTIAARMVRGIRPNNSLKNKRLKTITMAQINELTGVLALEK